MLSVDRPSGVAVVGVPQKQGGVEDMCPGNGLKHVEAGLGSPFIAD